MIWNEIGKFQMEYGIGSSSYRAESEIYIGKNNEFNLLGSIDSKDLERFRKDKRKYLGFDQRSFKRSHQTNFTPKRSLRSGEPLYNEI